MSGFKNILLDPGSISLDASSRLRSSQMESLGDYKSLNADDTRQFENTVLNVGGGTTTGTWGSNVYTMQMTGVSSGSYVIRRSYRYHPYYAGHSMIGEFTFENFHVQTNIQKRVGLFSSNNATPYNSNLDGFWLENDGTTVRLRISRNGTSILDLAQASWDNPITGHDWSKFNAILLDFIWLGGAQMRLFVKTASGFTLCHTYSHASTGTGVAITSPQHSARYEMRATGAATGTFTPICALVATEGQRGDHGLTTVVRNNGAAFAGVTAATIGTNYVVAAVRKRTGFRDHLAKFLDCQVFVTSADQLCVRVIKNPTYTGTALSYANIGRGLDAAIPTGALASTVTEGTGTELFAYNITQNTAMALPQHYDDFLSYLGSSIGDVSDTIALVVTPISASVTLHGVMRFKEL